MEKLGDNFIKIEPSGQTRLDFEAFEFDNILKELNKKYPYAKPVVKDGGKGVFLVGSTEEPMNFSELIEHYKKLNKLYKPDENDHWTNK
ncbi:MAG: hypothetical protein WC603_00010 [Candidatus Paceibacterota bacterium]|jgi:hypothetical protein